jgi:hypothetical protein
MAEGCLQYEPSLGKIGETAGKVTVLTSSSTIRSSRSSSSARSSASLAWNRAIL